MSDPSGQLCRKRWGRQNWLPPKYKEKSLQLSLSRSPIETQTETVNPRPPRLLLGSRLRCFAIVEIRVVFFSSVWEQEHDFGIRFHGVTRSQPDITRDRTLL